jgi:drug/metabolite transporter (DMT)-like permease
VVAVLAGALCYAISAVLARLRPPSHPLPSAAVTTLIASGLMLPWLLVPGGVEVPAPPAGSALLAVLALGVFSTAWASVIYFGLVRSAGPAFVSQLNYLIPLWAVGIGVLFLGEEPRASQLVALALILGGILFTQLERRRQPVVDPALGRD